MTTVLKVVGIAAVAFALGGVGALGVRQFTDKLRMFEDVETAFFFLAAPGEPNPQRYQPVDIPRALQAKHEVARYYLLRAAELGLEDESNANLLLGNLFLLQGNCELGAYYLERHVAEADAPARRAEDALAVLRGKDCSEDVAQEARSLLPFPSSSQGIDLGS